MVASAETTGETHGGHSYPWHLVEPSIWPILCASTLLAVTAGAVIGLTQADESLVRAHADQHPWEGLQNDGADVRDLHWSLR